MIHSLLDRLREKIDTYYNTTGRFPEVIIMPIDALRELNYVYDCRYSISLTFEYESGCISGSFEGIPMYFSGRAYDYEHMFEDGIILKPRLEEFDRRYEYWAKAVNSSIAYLNYEKKDSEINDISEDELLTILEVKK